ncbi:MAG: DUF1574 family protein [Gemmataceae bacterium]
MSRRIASSRPARGALLWGIGLFLASQLVFALLLEAGLTKLNDPEYEHRLALLRARLSEAPSQRPLMLVLGSSRAAMGVCPDRLTPPHPDSSAPLIFNFSLLGSGPVMELMCLRRLLDDGIRPDAVLIECWPPFLNQEKHNAEEQRFDKSRLRWGDVALLDRYWSGEGRIRREWAAARAVPAYSSRFVILNRYLPKWLPWYRRVHGTWTNLDPWGWQACADPEANDAMYRARVEIARQFYEPVLQDFHISPIADQALRELLTLCRRERIGAALVILPEGSTFRSWYPASVRARTDVYFASLCQEFHVPLVDARDWIADGQFYDGFHLLPQGALAFSERLRQQWMLSVLIAHSETWRAAGVSPPMLLSAPRSPR